MTSQKKTLILTGVVLVAVLCIYGIHRASMPPCVRWLQSHTEEMEQFSKRILEMRGSDRLVGGTDFEIPKWLQDSGVNYVERAEGIMTYTYYRWYTFPDGAMDHLVFASSNDSVETVTGKECTRKPVDEAYRLSGQWFYVETE